MRTDEMTRAERVVALTHDDTDHAMTFSSLSSNPGSFSHLKQTSSSGLVMLKAIAGLAGAATTEEELLERLVDDNYEIISASSPITIERVVFKSREIIDKTLAANKPQHLFICNNSHWSLVSYAPDGRGGVSINYFNSIAEKSPEDIVNSLAIKQAALEDARDKTAIMHAQSDDGSELQVRLTATLAEIEEQLKSTTTKLKSVNRSVSQFNKILRSISKSTENLNDINEEISKKQSLLLEHPELKEEIDKDLKRLYTAKSDEERCLYTDQMRLISLKQKLSPDAYLGRQFLHTHDVRVSIVTNFSAALGNRQVGNNCATFCAVAAAAVDHAYKSQSSPTVSPAAAGGAGAPSTSERSPIIIDEDKIKAAAGDLGFNLDAFTTRDMVTIDSVITGRLTSLREHLQMIVTSSTSLLEHNGSSLVESSSRDTASAGSSTASAAPSTASAMPDSSSSAPWKNSTGVEFWDKDHDLYDTHPAVVTVDDKVTKGLEKSLSELDKNGRGNSR